MIVHVKTPEEALRNYLAIKNLMMGTKLKKLCRRYRLGGGTLEFNAYMTGQRARPFTVRWSSAPVSRQWQGIDIPARLNKWMLPFVIKNKIKPRERVPVKPAKIEFGTVIKETDEQYYKRLKEELMNRNLFPNRERNADEL